MKTMRFTWTGKTPLLLHADNVAWADAMSAYNKRPEKKDKGSAGDDRVPAYRWLGCLHHDGERLVIPAEYIMAVLRGGGSAFKMKGQKSFKSETQSMIVLDSPFMPLLVGGKEVAWAPLNALREQSDFAKHVEAARAAGFDLDVRRATIPKVGSKHIRVRPIFENWAVGGTLRVFDESMGEILPQIMEYAGLRVGMGDWRPSQKSPGPFGQFTATCK